MANFRGLVVVGSLILLVLLSAASAVLCGLEKDVSIPVEVVRSNQNTEGAQGLTTCGLVLMYDLQHVLKTLLVKWGYSGCTRTAPDDEHYPDSCEFEDSFLRFNLVLCHSCSVFVVTQLRKSER